MHRWLPLWLVLVLSVALGFGLLKKNDVNDDPAFAAFDISPFDVPTLNSSTKRFNSDLWKDKVVVLNVFASWCLPCAAEHPSLMALAKTGKVHLLGMAWKDKPPAVQKWLAERGNPFQIVGIDEKGASTIALGLSGVPETFVIQNNRVVFHWRSVLGEDTMSKTIIPLVERLRHE